MPWFNVNFGTDVFSDCAAPPLNLACDPKLCRLTFPWISFVDRHKLCGPSPRNLSEFRHVFKTHRRVFPGHSHNRFIRQVSWADLGSGKGLRQEDWQMEVSQSQWGVWETNPSQKLFIFCRLHYTYNDLLRKKAKQYFVNLALQTAVLYSDGRRQGVHPNPANPAPGSAAETEYQSVHTNKLLVVQRLPCNERRRNGVGSLRRRHCLWHDTRDVRYSLTINAAQSNTKQTCRFRTASNQKALTRGRSEHFSNAFLRWPWTMTTTFAFEFDLVSNTVKQQVKYLG